MIKSLQKQDIFKEEAAWSDGGSTLPYPEEDWPSDDSQDHDYDPERNENSCSISPAGTEGNASDDTNSSISLSWSFEDEVLSGSKRSGIISADSYETSDCEIISGRRQRRAVDYKKLYVVSIFTFVIIITLNMLVSSCSL